jgi:hypothetical protein
MADKLNQSLWRMILAQQPPGLTETVNRISMVGLLFHVPNT